MCRPFNITDGEALGPFVPLTVHALEPRGVYRVVRDHEGLMVLYLIPVASALLVPLVTLMDARAPREDVVAFLIVGASLILSLSIVACRSKERRKADTPKYAFAASTRVQHSGPTVLRFAARVPAGSGAPPTIKQTFGDKQRRPNR